MSPVYGVTVRSHRRRRDEPLYGLEGVTLPVGSPYPSGKNSAGMGLGASAAWQRVKAPKHPASGQARGCAGLPSGEAEVISRGDFDKNLHWLRPCLSVNIACLILRKGITGCSILMRAGSLARNLSGDAGKDAQNSPSWIVSGSRPASSNTRGASRTITHRRQDSLVYIVFVVFWPAMVISMLHSVGQLLVRPSVLPWREPQGSVDGEIRFSTCGGTPCEPIPGLTFWASGYCR
jgi:hypothetical protein